MNSDITYHLVDFDGPLDLLLRLIRVNEMDVLNISIVPITEQYLAVLNDEKERNLDVAGEFLVMAATLMSVKSAYLLPKPDPALDYDEELAEFTYEEDPRETLVAQLLEYQRYKDAAVNLEKRAEQRRLHYSHEMLVMPEDLKGKLPMPEGTTMADLQNAFERVMKKRVRNKEQSRTMLRQTWSVNQQMTFIIDCFKAENRSLIFDSFFTQETSDDFMITTFLAMLDLVRYHYVMIEQDVEFGQIMLHLTSKKYDAQEILKGTEIDE